MKSNTLSLTLIAAVATLAGISSASAEDGGRRYFHSPTHFNGKTGVTYTQPRGATIGLFSKSTGVGESAESGRKLERNYSHSPVPVASKTGVSVSYR